MTVKLTWLSHACFLIETEDVKIIVDPFLTGESFSVLQHLMKLMLIIYWFLMDMETM